MRIGLCGALLALLLATPLWAQQNGAWCVMEDEIDPNYKGGLFDDPIQARLRIQIHDSRIGPFFTYTIVETIVYDSVKTAYSPIDVPAVYYMETQRYSIDGNQTYGGTMGLGLGRARAFPFKLVSFHIDGRNVGQQVTLDHTGHKPSREIFSLWSSFATGGAGSVRFAAPTGQMETRMEGSMRVPVGPIYHPAKTVEVRRRYANADYAQAAGEMEAALIASMAKGECRPVS